MRPQTTRQIEVGPVRTVGNDQDSMRRLYTLSVAGDGFHTHYLEPGVDLTLRWSEERKVWTVLGGTWMHERHNYRLAHSMDKAARSIPMLGRRPPYALEPPTEFLLGQRPDGEWALYRLEPGGE